MCPTPAIDIYAFDISYPYALDISTPASAHLATLQGPPWGSRTSDRAFQIPAYCSGCRHLVSGIFRVNVCACLDSVMCTGCWAAVGAFRCASWTHCLGCQHPFAPPPAHHHPAAFWTEPPSWARSTAEIAPLLTSQTRDHSEHATPPGSDMELSAPEGGTRGASSLSAGARTTPPGSEATLSEPEGDTSALSAGAHTTPARAAPSGSEAALSAPAGGTSALSATLAGEPARGCPPLDEDIGEEASEAWKAAGFSNLEWHEAWEGNTAPHHGIRHLR